MNSKIKSDKNKFKAYLIVKYPNIESFDYDIRLDYVYDIFLDYLNGSEKSQYINIFEDFLRYIKTKNYDIKIGKNNYCLRYVDDYGTGLKAIKRSSFDSFIKYVENNYDKVFPAYSHKYKLGNLKNEQILKASEYYLGNDFYKKYMKYKLIYLSSKHLLSK